MKNPFEERKIPLDSRRWGYALDPLGRPTKIVYPDRREFSYAYDDSGNTVEISDSAIGTTSLHYDILDRLTKVTYPSGKAFSYIYDAVGNRTKVTYANGTVVSYEYNLNNWLTAVITKSGRTLYEYDKVGNLTRRVFPNGVIASYTYDSADRLAGLVIEGPDGHTLFSFSYTLDALGNCLRMENSDNTTVYAYDSLYQVTKVKYPDGREVDYKYDSMGNRLSAISSTVFGGRLLQSFVKVAANLGFLRGKTSYSYDSEGHLIRAGNIGFEYDKDGNLIEKRSGDGTTRYFYDVDNRLVRIDYPNGTHSEYVYDALGRRVVKTDTSGEITHYLYDGYNLAQELDDKERAIASYIYDIGVDHPISMTRDGRTYYYLYNHLGSVIALIDESGDVVAQYEYDAWGNISKEVGDIENPFRFAGREWDEESGLYYCRARYYDPSVGRFISEDNAGEEFGQSSSSNSYIYVRNNPVNLVDPFGQSPWRWGPENALWQYVHGGNPVEYALEFYAQKAANTLEGVKSVWTRSVQNYMSWGNWEAKALNAYAQGNVGLSNWYATLDAISYGARHTPIIRDFVINASDIFDPAVSWGTRIKSVAFDIPFDTFMLAPGTFYKAASNVFRVPHYAAKLSFAKTLPLLSFQKIKGMAGAKVLWPGRKIFPIVSKSFKAPVAGILDTIGNLKSMSDIGKFFAGEHVGGVLFDQAAEVLTELEEITGAYWDENLGQLVLVGRKNDKVEEQYLPAMDKHHLAVAMRAVFSADNLGVSIDPPSSYLESGQTPPDGTPMLVRYLGNTKDTLFGAIMFEADRLLKNLSMGRDNEAESEVTSQVPGFQSELDLSMTYRTGDKHSWHRMWFVIEDMKLDMRVKEASDRGSLVFDKATLKVKAEYVTGDKSPGVSRAAENFAQHFTLHFDDLAKEYPILERLRELAKISAVAKYLKDSGKPVDLSFLDDYEYIKVPTPETTPGVTASKSLSEGNMIHTCSLYGGVDFDFKYKSIRDDEEAIALEKTARNAKPCDTSLRWDLRFKGSAQRAIVFPMAKLDGNRTIIHTDLSLSSRNGTSLELSRFYDSSNNKPSIFGYGWRLKTPYKVFILNPNKEMEANEKKFYPSILLIDKVNGKSHKYNYIKDRETYCLVIEEKEKDHGISFSYDPQQSIKQSSDGNFALSSKEGITYNFDRQGILVSIVDKDNKGIYYTHQDDRVVKISDSTGRSIDLTYDYRGWVRQAIGPGQRKIDYIYTPYGNLVRVLCDGKTIMSYDYDAEHRLVTAKDAEGNVILRNSYDPLGRLIRKKRDVVTDVEGNPITRTYDNSYRLTREEDEEGDNILYEYDRKNHLTKTTFTDRRHRSTVFDHNEEERVRRITNPLGHSARFTYDISGNLASVTNPNGSTRSFKYDRNGNPILVRDAMGNEWKQGFDKFSRLTDITDPMGRTASLTYEDDKLSSIRTPEGVIRYEYDERGNITKITDVNGDYIEFAPKAAMLM